MSAFIHAVFGLTDVQHVGKRKAIGYVPWFERPQPPFMTRPVQEEELAAVADELTERGIEMYWDHSNESRGHQAEIATLCELLPQRMYCRKLRPSYHLMPWHTPQLFAVDPLVIESFLFSNRECLYGYPLTAEAFVDLVRSVWVEETTPLGQMIRLAFSRRGLYGPSRP